MTDDTMATPTAAASASPAQPPGAGQLAGRHLLARNWRRKGQVTYEWMDGGFFLLQQVALEQYGQRIEGLEIIGHERQFGAEPSQDIKSRFYDSLGNTLDYVYQLDGDTLTIWPREGLPGLLRGHLQRRRQHRCWRLGLPGGGYESTMTRVGSPEGASADAPWS